MSFDYKTLQMIGSELPPPADRYCPECGQSLSPPVVAIDTPSSRRSWVFLIAGIYLLIVSGLHGVPDAQLVARGQQFGRMTGRINVEDGSPANQLLPYAMARLSHDLLVGAGGLMLLLVAFGSGVRRRLVRDHPSQASVRGALVEVWGAGETLVGALSYGALLVFGYLFVSEVVAGETVSVTLMDRTVSGTVELIRSCTELVGSGYPRP